MINGIEYQPALMALIKAGYVGLPQLINYAINEKKGRGIATVKLKNSDEPIQIYYNKNEDIWAEKKPDYYDKIKHAKVSIHPSIIAKHYQSAI